jgi:hypothetical protein
MSKQCRPQRPSGLRCGSETARLLGLRVALWGEEKKKLANNIDAYKVAASSTTPNQTHVICEDAFYLRWKRKWRNLISFKNLNGDPRNSHDCPLLTWKHSLTKEALIPATHISWRRFYQFDLNQAHQNTSGYDSCLHTIKWVHSGAHVSTTKSTVGDLPLVFIYFITYMHNVLGDDAIKDDYMNYLANGMFNSEQMKAPINK